MYYQPKMARIWKEQLPKTKLRPRWKYHVQVCSFTFEFWDLAQVQATLEFYQQKTHPSSRWAKPKSLQNERYSASRRAETLRWVRAEGYVVQRWWERLPMRLQQNNKRLKVIKALQQALTEFTKTEFS